MRKRNMRDIWVEEFGPLQPKLGLIAASLPHSQCQSSLHEIEIASAKPWLNPSGEEGKREGETEVRQRVLDDSAVTVS